MQFSSIFIASTVAAAAILLSAESPAFHKLKSQLISDDSIARILLTVKTHLAGHMLYGCAAIIAAIGLYKLLIAKPSLSFISRAPADKSSSRRGNTPPPYPTGWFKLIDSRDLPNKAAKHVNLLGTNLVVYRGQSGKAFALDAYCPHLGANLGIGGVVKEDCIMCPFHGWEFAGDGQCVAIPYADKVPSFAKTNSWPVREVNQVVYVWHDVDGREPLWEVPAIAEVDQGPYVHHGSSAHRFEAHIQEILEVYTDTAYLDTVSQALIPGLPALVTKWRAQWSSPSATPPPAAASKSGKGKAASAPLDENASPSSDPSAKPVHVSKLTIQQRTSLCGIPLPLLSWDMQGEIVGPSIVHLRCQTMFGGLVLVESLVPRTAIMQEGSVNVFGAITVPRIIATWVLRSFVSLFDSAIWSTKAYVSAPLTLAEDGPILRFRAWFEQFYSKSGKRKKEGLDW